MKNNFKKIFTAALFITISSNTIAQEVATGYYRVQNVSVGQCLYLKSNVRQEINWSQGTIPMPNIRGSVDKEAVYGMPATVIKITNEKYYSNLGITQVDISAQGLTASGIAGDAKFNLEKAKTGTYYAQASKDGVEKYLKGVSEMDEYTWEELDCRVTTGKRGETGTEWKLLKLDESTNYFGILPRVELNGEYYDAFYAAFPYSFASSGMKAYCITKAPSCNGKYYAVYEEVTTDIPESTPLIIKCSSKLPSGNKLKINGVTATTKPSTNLMEGVYRCCTEQGLVDVKPYDSKTMRVLGVTSEGKIGFVKTNIKNVPLNTAYLKVPSDFPDELTLVSKEEYEGISAGINDVYTDENTISKNVKGVYNLSGAKVAESSEFENLPSGVYIVDGKQRIK